MSENKRMPKPGSKGPENGHGPLPLRLQPAARAAVPPSDMQREFLRDLLVQMNDLFIRLDAPTFTVDEWLADTAQHASPFSKRDYSMAINRAKYQVKANERAIFYRMDPNRHKSGKGETPEN